MQVHEIELVIQAWVDEFRQQGARENIQHVQIFENRGAMMGASNPHPHCQIWATASIPEAPAKELAAQGDYLRLRNRCLLCDYLELENQQKGRLVYQNQGFAALVPFWAVWPFETLVLSRRHLASMDLCTETERNDLAKMRQTLDPNRQALALDPKVKDAYTLQGNIDLARGSAESAKAHFVTAIQADPNGLSNYLALEDEYEKEGRWEEAKKVCERARQTNPSSPVLAFVLAHLYLDHGGDVNVAVSLAQMARQRMPGSPATADLLGWAFYKEGAAEAAIAQFKESVHEAPENPTFQYHLGMAYLASGRSDLAGESLRRALVSGPRFAETASAKAALDKVSKQSLLGPKR